MELNQTQGIKLYMSVFQFLHIYKVSGFVYSPLEGLKVKIQIYTCLKITIFIGHITNSSSTATLGL